MCLCVSVCERTGGRGTWFPNGRRADEGTIPNSQRADEGTILNGPLPVASEEQYERGNRATTDIATPPIRCALPRGEPATLLD